MPDLNDTWRLIDDELPSEETPVWLWDGKMIFIGERVQDDDDGWLFARCLYVPWWDADNGWRSDDSEADDYNPTHWRPLPQPPTSQQEHKHG